MKDKAATMQSDEVIDESLILVKTEAITTVDKMTYSDSRDSSSIKLKPQISTDDSAKYFVHNEAINLEDDIEKVEVSSPESSESIEDLTKDLPNIDRRPFFSGIPDQNPNESIKNWLQRITELQKQLSLNNDNNVSSPNVPLSDYNMKTPPTLFNSNSNINNISPMQNPSRVVKYQDLPYMGEMTLDNSKPRRGRKPKKADICHLIYKNYGTIFPGTPNAKSYTNKDSGLKKPDGKDSSLSNHENINRSDVQNRIISSLLEKRLTQEIKKSKENLLSSNKSSTKKSNQNEPLNLCIRDLNHLKIRLLKKTDNTYTSEIKSEPQSDDDVELINETPSPSLSLKGELKFPPSTPDSFTASSPDLSKTPENGVAPGGYVYWPNAGVFIHPMALQQHLMYYQRMAASNNYTLPSHSPRPPPESPNKESPTQELRKLVPKTRPKDETESMINQSNEQQQKTKRNASLSSLTDSKTPTKRKRSAIFIPPIPTENNTNPATEVSICKFKFTGGAKPSLQEKKMLSVDSGGNFRYYSGTGDKSMRGYEFFPRETLQQQINNTQGSSTGAFLQASGEKMYPVSPVDFTGTKANTEFMLTPPELSPPPPTGQVPAELNGRHKKRKSRKSLQREKLEQTFKEKGFLIQTQQLESAEGSTYCKFRQLRKFTRYLFRSWKDYLPGSVRELQESEKNDTGDDVLVAAAINESQDDNLSRHSSEISTNNNNNLLP